LSAIEIIHVDVEYLCSVRSVAGLWSCYPGHPPGDGGYARAHLLSQLRRCHVRIIERLDERLPIEHRSWLRLRGRSHGLVVTPSVLIEHVLEELLYLVRARCGEREVLAVILRNNGVRQESRHIVCFRDLLEL